VQRPKIWQPRKVATKTLVTKTFVMTQKSGDLNFNDENFGVNHDHNFCNRKNSVDQKRL
jgi:hypothetical protein